MLKNFVKFLRINIIQQVEHSATIIRDLFSIIAIVVATFTVIANTVFLGGRITIATQTSC
ncbi:hypothetical protein HQ545_03190 [Candidatus Woesearchaeota archaeon]|nr:hypothetical protein [Candidatus Woesearchaeota archaeon]